MFLLLITVSLLIHEGSAQNENVDLVTKLNALRKTVAEGKYVTEKGYLQPSQTMFELVRNENLEAWANIATSNCQGLNVTPPGGSMNIYTTALPVEMPGDTMITIALSAWMSESSDPSLPIVTYRQQNFVNMMYYKSTQVGCSYQKCDVRGFYFYSIACAFDQSIHKTDKVYEISEEAGCITSTCRTVYSDATCLDSGLCSRPAPTTTSTTTTTTPAPSPTLKKCKFYYALQKINAYRAALANGLISNVQGDMGGCTTMFALDCDPTLEYFAQFVVQGCQPKSVALPGNPTNFFSISRLPEKMNETDVIDMALATWMSELNRNGTALQNVKNMLYSKETKAACAYQECNTDPTPTRYAVACVFNDEPKKGDLMYDPTEEAEGCTGTNDCETVIPGATCGPEGLCHAPQP